LVAALGSAQPWLVMLANRLLAILAAAGVTTIYLDPDIPSTAPRWTVADVARVSGAQ